MVEAVNEAYARLNRDVLSSGINRAALDSFLQAQGEDFRVSLTADHAHLFSESVVYLSHAHLEQMRSVIAAVENVVRLPGWTDNTLNSVARSPNSSPCLCNSNRGVFYGYDFHTNDQGAYLIEINSNAGGGFLNALLIDSQQKTSFAGDAIVAGNRGEAFITMFQQEWQLARSSVPLHCIAILDVQPRQQFLYPEFILAKYLFESAGITVCIVDPAELQYRDDGVYHGNQQINLIYNRLTDFDLRHYPELRTACESHQVVLTPGPDHYARYADKRNLAKLTDAVGLQALGATDDDIARLQSGVPETLVVNRNMEADLWSARKQWFFKPVSGYGSKGAYRGEKLTKRVYAEIMQSDYVAQKMAVPGERIVSLKNSEVTTLKYDIRCYVYAGQIQLVAARLYQGQTTNFRTPGGGFALVRAVG